MYIVVLVLCLVILCGCAMSSNEHLSDTFTCTPQTLEDMKKSALKKHGVRDKRRETDEDETIPQYTYTDDRTQAQECEYNVRLQRWLPPDIPLRDVFSNPRMSESAYNQCVSVPSLIKSTHSKLKPSTPQGPMACHQNPRCVNEGRNKYGYCCPTPHGTYLSCCD